MATLCWGVKQSFRGYVEAAGGTVATTRGAERAPDGGFLFPEGPLSTLAQGADGRLRGAGRFQGEVSFNAHGGMLSVVLVDPWIEASEAGLILSVADSPAATRRLPFAKLDADAMTTEALTTGALTTDAPTTDAPTTDGGLVLPAAITLDGMFLLGDHYPPGTVLDPVRLLGLAGGV